MVLLLQMEGKCSSHCWDTEDAPGMPVTNLPPHQGDCLQHHAGPQHATSSHPRLPGHGEHEEEEGKHCRYGSSHGGERCERTSNGQPGSAPCGVAEAPCSQLWLQGLASSQQFARGMDQLVQTLFMSAPWHWEREEGMQLVPSAHPSLANRSPREKKKKRKKRVNFCRKTKQQGLSQQEPPTDSNQAAQ